MYPTPYLFISIICELIYKPLCLLQPRLQYLRKYHPCYAVTYIHHIILYLSYLIIDHNTISILIIHISQIIIGFVIEFMKYYFSVIFMNFLTFYYSHCSFVEVCYNFYHLLLRYLHKHTPIKLMEFNIN